MIHDIILRFLSAITGLDLPAASTNAVESDDLIFALIGGTVAVLGLVFGLMLLYGIKYRHGSDTSRGPEIEKSWRVEVTWTAATLVVFFGLFLWGADLYLAPLPSPPEHPENLRHRQAMDVEGRARRRPARDQRAARPGQPRRRARHDQRGRHPRLLHPRLPREARRRCPAATTSIWFTADQARHLPPVLHPVLRHRPFRHGRRGRRHDRPGLRPLARQQRRPRSASSREGRALFTHFGCSGCHQTADQRRGAGSTVRAPDLAGLYGSPVPLVRRLASSSPTTNTSTTAS